MSIDEKTKNYFVLASVLAFASLDSAQEWRDAITQSHQLINYVQTVFSTVTLGVITLDYLYNSPENKDVLNAVDEPVDTYRS